MCNCDPIEHVTIAGVPFKIGQTPQGLRWAIGQAAMPAQAGGGILHIITECPGAKEWLYAKAHALVAELNALVARLPQGTSPIQGSRHAIASMGGIISGVGPFMPADMPTQIMGPRPYLIGGSGPFMPADMPTSIMGLPHHRADAFSMGAPWMVGDILSDIGSGFDALGHAITHPGDVVNAIGQFLAHPGEIAKPLAYGAMLALGPVGVGYAFAADKAGVLDGAAKVIDLVGGIYIGIVKSVALGLGCTWVLNQLGLSELAFTCAIFSMVVDFIKAVVNHHAPDMVDILTRLMLLARQYGLDPRDQIKGFLNVVFQTAGAEIAQILGSIEDIKQALIATAALPLEDINYIIGQIKEQESMLKIDIPKLPDNLKGSLPDVGKIVATPKVLGQDALANGLKVGPIHPDIPGPILFAPRLRKFVAPIDAYANVRRAFHGSTAPISVGFLTFSASSVDDQIVANLNQGLAEANSRDGTSANERLQFADMFDLQSLTSIDNVLSRIPSNDDFKARIRARLQPFPSGVYERGR